MSEPRLADLAPSQIRHFERICTRFEKAWKSGATPNADEFLGDTPEPERTILRHELQALVEAYRKPPASSATLDYTPAPADDTAPPHASDPTWPRIPNYEILGRLGHGGMGVVYKARQIALKRIVALKMIRFGPSAEPGQFTRFQSEAETVARLQHPNIVQIFDIDEHDGQPYFALEFIEGGTLAQKLAGNPQPPRQAAELARLLASTMQAAHERGIIHRDLKPANILLSADGIPKITDFGLAKQLGADEGHTGSGAILGTPSYMAPEQASGKSSAIDAAADVYSLGAILYELLTGRPPFRGPTPLDTMDQVRNQEPVPPSRLQPKLPRDLETITLKCLDKDPARRYPSAALLAEDLRRFLAAEPILARPARQVERALKWTRRHPWIATAAGLFVMTLASLLIGLVVYGMYQEQGRVLAERTLSEERRLQTAGAESQEAYGQAKVFFDRGEYENARTELVRARAKIGAEESFAELTTRVAELLRETDRRLEEKPFYEEFVPLEELALFHAVNVTGQDRVENVRHTRKCAAAALAVYGIVPRANAPPRFMHEVYTPARRDDLSKRCVDLTLILADATATVLPGEDTARQADEALRVLNHLQVLGPATSGYFARRTRFLTLKGDRTAAASPPKESGQQDAALSTTTDHFLAGLDAHRRGNALEARLELAKVLDAVPNHFWANFVLGSTFFDERRFAKAEESFAVCVRQKPNFVWPYLLRGLSRGELAYTILTAPQQDSSGAQVTDATRLKEARFYFQQADEDFEKAKTLERNSDADCALHLNRGLVRLRRNDTPAAIEDFRAADGLRPKQFQTKLNLAAAYLQKKESGPALAAADAAIELAPKLPAAHRLRAAIHLLPSRRDLGAALADLEAAIALDSHGKPSADVAEDQRQRGAILIKLGRLDEGIDALAQAVALQPALAGAHRLRAEALMEQRREREAIASWDAYLREAARTPGRLPKDEVARSYKARGVLRSKLGQHLPAVDDLSSALELAPDSLTFALRGWLHVVLEAPKAAREDFDHAIELDDKNGDAYNGRAVARLQLGEPAHQGLADADKALALGPKQPRHWYNAARAYALAAVRESLDRKATSARPGFLTPIQSQAFELIRQTLALLPSDAKRREFWRQNIVSDKALVVLRRLPEFARLAAEQGVEITTVDSK